MEESYFIEGFQDYLELLAEKNKLVSHKKITTLSPGGQICFSRYESDEHINQIAANGGNNIIVVADYYGQRIGQKHERKVMITVTIRFCSKKISATGDESEAITMALATAEKILLQFLAKMEADAEAGCNPLQDLMPDRITWNPIEQPWLDNYYGWDLQVPFKSYLDNHNPDNWESFD